MNVRLIIGYFVKYPEFVKSKIVIDSHGSQATLVIGQLSVSKDNIEKVKAGQKVIVKLYDFPYQEFGTLEGKIKQVSFNANGSKIDVVFPDGLKTSYNKKLSFDKELQGNAEVVTKDFRLMDKLFYQIKKL